MASRPASPPPPPPRPPRRRWVWVPIAGLACAGAGVAVVAWGMNAYADRNDLAASGTCVEAWSVLRAGSSTWGAIAQSGALVGVVLFLLIVLPIAAYANGGPRPTKPHFHYVQVYQPMRVERRESWSRHNRLVPVCFIIGLAALFVSLPIVF